MNRAPSEPKSAKAIFLKAMELSDIEQRQDWLRQQCQDDPDLLRKVEVLLNAAGANSVASPLDDMANAMGVEKTVLTAELEPSPDATTKPLPAKFERQQIGPYKLLEQIGQGGFGTVYMAEQTAPIKRKVALKVLKPGMDSGEVIARFEAERQALAMMDHPNIARVLDGGTTEQGRPYFVMELVRGVPVTDYCDEVRATTEERLALFVDICRAVQHAHQKGIIHRDLKPSNVLVTMHDDKPVPKVIDFGIAKALSQQLTDRTLFTGYQQMLGTPAYMSPEQAQMSGIDIDTRSDVYSLGVLLYELLTGTTPFDKSSMNQISFDDLRKMIREQEPPRPSARITTMEANLRSTMADRRRIDQRRVSEQLRGELDWVVMKALEKDRNRRYESASALAADVQRYLTDEPVLACPPSMGYRLSKLIQRNRLAFTGSAFALLVMVAAIVGLSVTNSILSDAKQRTDDALDKARHNEQIAETRSRESVVAAAAAQASEEQAQKERRLAEEHYRRSLELVQSLVESISEWKLSEQPGMERYRLQLLESARDALTSLHTPERVDRQLVELRIQVLTALATDYRSMQRHQESATAFRTATGYADELASQFESDGQAYRVLRWSLRYQLMIALQTLGQRDDAIREIKTAIRLAEDQLKEHTEDQTLRSALCNMWGGLSVLENEVGNTAASQEAVNRQGRLLGFALNDDLQLLEPVTQAQLQPLIDGNFSDDTVRTYLLLLAPRQQNPEIRAALLDEALNIGREQVRSEGTRSRRFQHAFELNQAAAWLSQSESGSAERAAKYLQEAIPLLESLVADFPTLTLYRSDLVRANAALLSNLVALQRFEEAAAFADALAERYPEETLINETLGDFYAERGQDAQEALNYYDRMIASAGGHATAYHYRHRGKFLAEQMKDAARALADFDRAFALEPRPEAYWFSLRAAALNALGRRDEAIAFLDSVSPNSAGEFCDRANTYHQLQLPDRELADLDKALELRPDLLYRHKRRALCHFQLGHFVQALVDLSTGLELQPDDISHLTWIDLRLVADCPDSGFRAGLRKLADRLVELNQQSLPSLLTRAEVCLALGDVEQAGADFDAALKAPEASVSVYYRTALFSLTRNDQSRCCDLCRAVLERFGQSTTPDDNSFTAWTCSLAPQAIDDYAAAVKLAEQAVAATTPAQRWELGALGAILLRSGNAERALQVLADAAQQPASEKTSAAYVVYFEALALQQLGRSEEAAAKLKDANALADRELSQTDAPPAWNRRQTLELLRKETEELIEPSDGPPPN